ncbi:SpdD protein [Streptomyces sp. NBC_01242]|uniref:SpdD protein n=1 Tax=unclassified Streptomyces TaxID=2593676 RepID=UPI00225311D2|nr:MULTISPECIES: SpdD protein [unclassified Streptomyces]MCX4796477.1 SpdD protein [Streptomyces sp. NBC_01242]WSJ37708.1 SpdD protein [Streptomyces sp. NBC_01321]
MFTPKYPTPDTAPTPTTSLVRPPAALAHPAACDCQHTPATTSAPTPAPVPATRSAVQLTPGALVVAAAGGTAVVLVVGAVLVSMLLAVAITATSVAVCAVVLRSLLNNQNHQR